MKVLAYKDWEKGATIEQIKIRDHIEREAIKTNDPPSIKEFELIKSGKISKNWSD